MDFFDNLIPNSENRYSLKASYYLNLCNQKYLRSSYSDEKELVSPSMYYIYLVNNKEVEKIVEKEVIRVILRKFFNKSHNSICDILANHNQESSIKCNLYTKDIAETKISALEEFIKVNHYPLKLILKKAK